MHDVLGFIFFLYSTQEENETNKRPSSQLIIEKIRGLTIQTGFQTGYNTDSFLTSHP